MFFRHEIKGLRLRDNRARPQRGPADWAERLKLIGRFFTVVARLCPTIDARRRAQTERLRPVLRHIDLCRPGADPRRARAAGGRFPRAPLFQLFEEAFALSPMQYLARVRAGRAAILITQGAKLKTIADTLGYADV